MNREDIPKASLIAVIELATIFWITNHDSTIKASFDILSAIQFLQRSTNVKYVETETKPTALRAIACQYSTIRTDLHICWAISYSVVTIGEITIILRITNNFFAITVPYIEGANVIAWLKAAPIFRVPTNESAIGTDASIIRTDVARIKFTVVIWITFYCRTVRACSNIEWANAVATLRKFTSVIWVSIVTFAIWTAPGIRCTDSDARWELTVVVRIAGDNFTIWTFLYI
mmetsp:Transcript_17719/g.26240  ORF Transcript_17719/g.26240 Transcript_17719/m.26240 type:complete len:230 (-) Transcript_17719:1652-2341(-)